MTQRIFLLSVFCFLLLSSDQVDAQSPYTLDQRQELSLLGIGAGLNVISGILKDEIDPLDAEEIAVLDRRSIAAIDRRATFNYSHQAARASDLTRNISVVLPLALLASKRVRTEFGKIAIMMSETYLLVSGATFVAKTATERARPYVYNDEVPIAQKGAKSAQFSFFSGHTSLASGLSFFAAKVFSDYYPESPWKPVVWTVAATLPAVTGYLRVRAGKHFPTDVVAGYVVGAIGGILVPALHKTDRRSSWGYLDFSATNNGLALVYRF